MYIPFQGIGFPSVLEAAFLEEDGTAVVKMTTPWQCIEKGNYIIPLVSKNVLPQIFGVDKGHNDFWLVFVERWFQVAQVQVNGKEGLYIFLVGGSECTQATCLMVTCYYAQLCFFSRRNKVNDTVNGNIFEIPTSLLNPL